MSQVQKALDAVDRELDASLARLFDFLRIPSISTDSAYDAYCIKAAEWAATTLRDIGFDASSRKTIGHPIVVGHHRSGRSGVPHVLFYGHYDVQPPDPLELWVTKPFEPVRQAGPHGDIILARGASDDKGQVMTFIEACRALIAIDGKLPIDVTVFLEGEEESSSRSLAPFLTENRDELRADFCLICDTGMWDRDTPAVITMLRGIVYEEVTIKAASRDLHSGTYGGAAQNPIHVLSKILAALHDDDGRVTLPGFYDGVKDLPPQEKAAWDALSFDGARFLGQVGLSVPAGEKDRSVLEQITVRPTCDVSGIIGGYTGDGAKTVIAAQASAKVSFRLVAGQEPARVQTTFRQFVAARLPADCKAAFQLYDVCPAIVVPSDSQPLTKARNALAEEWGRKAPAIGCGGSGPEVSDMKNILGINSLLIGFGLEDDQIHSPNEKYDLRSFRKGIRSWIRILDALAK